MESLGSTFAFNSDDLGSMDFTSSISTDTGENMQNNPPPNMMPYPGMRQGHLGGEQVFNPQGQIPGPRGGTRSTNGFEMPRYPGTYPNGMGMATLPNFSSPDMNQIVPRGKQPFLPAGLPNITSFSDPLHFLPPASLNACGPGSLIEKIERLPSFSTIVASAASTISTMGLQRPFQNGPQSTPLEHHMTASPIQSNNGMIPPGNLPLTTISSSVENFQPMSPSFANYYTGRNSQHQSVIQHLPAGNKSVMSSQQQSDIINHSQSVHIQPHHSHMKSRSSVCSLTYGPSTGHLSQPAQQSLGKTNKHNKSSLGHNENSAVKNKSASKSRLQISENCDRRNKEPPQQIESAEKLNKQSQKTDEQEKSSNKTTHKTSSTKDSTVIENVSSPVKEDAIGDVPKPDDSTVCVESPSDKPENQQEVHKPKSMMTTSAKSPTVQFFVMGKLEGKKNAAKEIPRYPDFNDIESAILAAAAAAAAARTTAEAEKQTVDGLLMKPLTDNFVPTSMNNKQVNGNEQVVKQEPDEKRPDNFQEQSELMQFQQQQYQQYQEQQQYLQDQSLIQQQHFHANQPPVLEHNHLLYQQQPLLQPVQQPSQPPVIQSSHNNSQQHMATATVKKSRQKQPTASSFNDATAKALVTTTVADNATYVTVSIMNKRNPLAKTNTTNTELASGGLSCVSFGRSGKSGKQRLFERGETGESENNDVDADKDTYLEESTCGAFGKKMPLVLNSPNSHVSILSKLKYAKDVKEELDRTEVSIRIDDSQCIVHGEQKRWQCHYCPKSYTTKHNLVTHILDHQGIKPHLCMICGKYFKQLSHLNTHMLTHDNIKPHVCQICGKGFTQISHLKRHQAVHLENKPYICDICNRGFAYPSELRVHKEKHVPGRDKCQDCGENFSSPRLLRQHQASHEHREDLTCKMCTKIFRYPSQLKDHMITHSGSRPHICPECGMDFMKEHHLKAHQFTHTGLRPFKCFVCGRSFNQKANMQRHLLIHNAERAFRCEICGKTFTQPQTLKAHMVVHAESKPYQCKICGKEFGRLHNLQGHMHMHNNSKPFVCFCGSSFTLKGNLNRHKKVKHGLNESTESMEEDAVNFLSSLSGRAREERHNSRESMDGDRDYLKEPSSTQRKQRKSTPRRIAPRCSLGSDDKDNSDDNLDQSISKYFQLNCRKENESSIKDPADVDGEDRDDVKRQHVETSRDGESENSDKGRSVSDFLTDSEKDDGAKDDVSDADWVPARKKRRHLTKSAKT